MSKEADATRPQKNLVKLFFLFILGVIIALVGVKTFTTGEMLTGGTFVLIGIGFIVVSDYL